MPPVGIRAPADQDDETRQVLILGAQSVGDPGAHRRATIARRARVEEQLGRRMIELVGVHRLDDGDLVDRAAQVGQELADHRAALTALLKLVWRAQKLGMPFDEGEPLVLEQLVRAGLHVMLDQLGLEVEQVLLGWSA